MEHIILFHFISNIIYTYSIFILLTTFLKNKSPYPKNVQIFCYFLFYLIITSVFSLIHIPLFTILINILGIYILTFLYNHKKLINFQVTIIIYSMLAIVDIIFAYLSKYSLNNLITFTPYVNIITVFAYNITILGGSLLLKYYLLKNKSKKVHLITSVFSISISSMSITLILILFLKTNIPMLIFIAVSIILLLINLIVVWGYEQLVNRMNEEIKIVKLEELNYSYQKQLEIMDEMLQNMRAFKHDEKNHLLSIRGFIEEKEDGKASAYIDEMILLLEPRENFITSKNQTINSLLNYKIQKAQNHNIIIHTIILLKDKLPISDFEFSIIVGNLLDNAIEGSLHIDKDERKIWIRIIDDKGKFTIQVDNNYDGFIEEENSQIVTRKSEGKLHGIGLRNVKKIVEKYDGLLKINQDNNKFCVYIQIIAR